MKTIHDKTEGCAARVFQMINDCRLARSTGNWKACWPLKLHKDIKLGTRPVLGRLTDLYPVDYRVSCTQTGEMLLSITPTEAFFNEDVMSETNARILLEAIGTAACSALSVRSNATSTIVREVVAEYAKQQAEQGEPQDEQYGERA